MQILNEILLRFKTVDYDSYPIGLQQGIMGISLLFFYYSRYVDDEVESDYAYDLLERVLSSSHLEQDISYSAGLAGIGCCINFLIKEKFIEADSEDTFEDFDAIIAGSIANYTHWDYSFQTGLIGICRYLMQRETHIDSVSKALNTLINAFRQKHSIDPLYLFPSEIMKDTELFLAELITKELFLDQAKTLLTEMAIFRDNNSVLHSNCEEYYGIQRLRKAMIENNREIITQEVKRISTTTSSDILKSIAIMTLNRPELPDWGKLV